MTTRIVHRPARTSAATPAPGAHGIERPPPLPEADSGLRSLLMLVPMLGAGASMTVMMLFRGSSFAAIGALMMVLTLIASAVMVFSQRGKAARQRRTQRDRYLDYLEGQRSELAAQERGYRRSSGQSHPDPRALLSVVRDPERLWERRRDDEDFLRVRIGTGPGEPRRFDRRGEDNPLQLTDDFMEAELGLVERRFETARDVPLVCDLDAAGNLSVIGDPEFRARFARLVMAQAAVFTSPEDLGLALVVPESRRTAWDWAQWLPHLADQNLTTPKGPVRRLAATPGDLQRLLRADLDRRSQGAAELRRNLVTGRAAPRQARMLVVVDTDGRHPDLLEFPDPEVRPADLGLSVVHLLESRLDEPGQVQLRVTQRDADGRFTLERYARGDVPPTVREGRLDELGVPEAEAVSRALASLRLSPDSLEHDPGRQARESTELLGIPDVERLDLDRLWSPRPRTSFLRVPIGTDDHGDPVMLDLKEAAQFGMGPHGLCVGATGSGKSELLRTLVLGLLATHGPDDLSMVLVDYKGGATFAPFAGVPQVSGIITNLSDDASLVERVYTSLSGEVQRRQEVLKAAGNLPDVTAYRKARRERTRAGDPSLAPLPHLLVIIDEFGELLTARPDFIELFLSIGRIGRSIGVHLLLSSQRIEGGRLRGLDTYLSYRIGLRTLSEAESRSVLDTVDAFALPPVPGYGYLKVDTTTYTRFRAGFVSGPLPEPEEVGAQETAPEVGRLGRYAVDELPRDDTGEGAPATVSDDEPSGPTVIEVMVDQLRERPRTAAPVWLPPMPDVLTLDRVAGPLQMTSAGLRLRHEGWLRAPIGLVDDPARQRQGVWELDLRVAGGHLLFVGGPGSGKTTALRTLASSLALTHAPGDLIVYGLDLLGSSLAPLADLPNVGGVAVRMDREVVRRTVEEVRALLSQRESLMQQLGADSMADLRRRAAVASAEDPVRRATLAEVVLLVDGYGQLAEEFEELEDLMASVVRRGSGYGIHVVATASRANEVRIRQQGFFGTRVELRLSDPGESAIGRQQAETITTDRPGRCLLGTRLFAQIALPRVDARAERGSAAEGQRDLAARAAGSTEARAPRVRLLPPVVTPAAVEPPARAGLVPLGLEETELATVFLDTSGPDRNLMVIGDPGTGRTALVRHLAESLREQYTCEEVVFAVFDPRRTLHGLIPEEYLGGYASSAALAGQLVAAIAPELQARVPTSVEGQAPQPAPIPRIVLLVDDYDVLTAGGGTPLAPLVPSIAMSRELNLSVVLTRRTSGAARGVFDPVFQAVRDSGGTGLLLSGDRSEGQLIGTVRPRPLPPGRGLLIRTGDQPVTVQTVLRTDDAGDRLGGSGFAR